MPNITLNQILLQWQNLFQNLMTDDFHENDEHFIYTNDNPIYNWNLLKHDAFP